MLCLTRYARTHRPKQSQIIIDDRIVITVAKVDVKDMTAHIAIDAPKDVNIRRAEVKDNRKDARQD